MRYHALYMNLGASFFSAFWEETCFFFFFHWFQYSFSTETIKIVIKLFAKRRYAFLNVLY